MITRERMGRRRRRRRKEKKGRKGWMEEGQRRRREKLKMKIEERGKEVKTCSVMEEERDCTE